MFEDVNPNPPQTSPPETAPAPADGQDSVAEMPVYPDPDLAAEESLDEPAAALVEWKDELRRDFEAWLAALDEIPDLPEDEEEGEETPDLFSFYEQLAASNAEARKANRRSAEAVSQWGETLARFEACLTPLRETTERLIATQPKEGQLSRAHCLLLVELLDRMSRLAAAFQSPPARTSWWKGNDAAWRKAWETQRQGVAILISHLEEWLKKEGVSRISARGQPFDPSLMLAVAVESDQQTPAQTVLEELAAGYRRHGELLRAAQVKVSVRNGASAGPGGTSAG